MSTLITTKGGAVILFLLFLAEVVMQILSFLVNRLLFAPGSLTWNIVHVVISLIILYSARAYIEVGECFTTTSPYTHRFWSDSLGFAGVIGLIAAFIAFYGETQILTIILVGSVFALYNFFPAVVAIKALTIAHHYFED